MARCAGCQCSDLRSSLGDPGEVEAGNWRIPRTSSGMFRESGEGGSLGAKGQREVVLWARRPPEAQATGPCAAALL